MGKQDPLAAALAIAPVGRSANVLRVVELFGARPDVLEAIKAARARHVSCATIARTLSTPGATIGESAIKTWLRSEGLD